MTDYIQADPEFQVTLFNASQCLIEEAVQRTKDDMLRRVMSGRLPVGETRQSSFAGAKIAVALAVSVAMAGYGGVKYLEAGGFAMPGETAPPTAVNIAGNYTPPETIVSDFDKTHGIIPVTVPAAPPADASASECSRKLKGADLAWCKKHGAWKPTKH